MAVAALPGIYADGVGVVGTRAELAGAIRHPGAKVEAELLLEHEAERIGTLHAHGYWIENRWIPKTAIR